MVNKKNALATAIALICTTATIAGDLNAPSAPTEPGSAMYQIMDIYNRLDTGTPGVKRSGSFVEPTTGPASTGRTLDEVMSKAPMADDTNGVSPSGVLAGETYWSLRTDGTWGPQTGIMINNGTAIFYPGTTDQPMGGYYTDSSKVIGDAELTAPNIAAGVDLFGVVGTAKVATGDATDPDVLAGKTYSSTAGASTGTMPNIGDQDFTPTTTPQSISAGYHDGNGTVAGDVNLLTGNIKSGATIFGVAGKTEVVDTTTGDAISADLLSGKRAWVDGSEVTGSATAGANVNGADGSKTFIVPDGLYSGSKTATANDADLIPANIATGKNILGVNGSALVSVGTAAAADVLTGKTFSNGTATNISGGMTIQSPLSITPTTTAQAIPGGYYSGPGSVAGDTDLVSGNIRNGVNLFGVAGDSAVINTAQLINPAAATDMATGKIAFINGAQVTGSVPAGSNVNGSEGSLGMTIPDGIYSGSKTATAQDSDLVTGNIKAGANIFGVSGKTEVVDTTTGDAVSADLLTGKKAWVDGSEVTGSATAGANVNGADGSKTFTIPDGLYTGNKTATANDADLIPGNIATGKNILGVTGSALVSVGTAAAADVLTGKTFSNGTATDISGSMTIQSPLSITPTTTAQAIPGGYYSGPGSVAGDADLVTGNIRSGVTLFGVSGKTEVVDTTTGDAVSADLLSGKKAWVDGSEVTGSATAGTSVSGADGSKTFTIPDGLYSGSKTATANDADLVSGNIKSGITIFGVAGDGNVIDTAEATNATAASDIAAGKVAFVNGSQVTGTVAAGGNVDGANGSLGMTIPDGIYSGSKTATAQDSNLVTGNIRAGTTIFGVVGKTEVVDTSTGDAVAADVLSGKKAWVDGSEVTGTANISAYPALVSRTGQTTCYDAAGTAIACTGTGQDGDVLAGEAWPNPRFTDNGDGTVRDNLTGLIWLKNANCFGTRDWTTALSDANGLANGVCDLSDGSSAGDWHLPNRNELNSLIDSEYFAPALSNANGDGQWADGDAFSAVVSYYYWSSTTNAAVTTNAWVVDLSGGFVSYGHKTNSFYVWPVRAGQ